MDIHRRIIVDSVESRVEEDTATRVRYHYRKDYPFGLDPKTEYSMVLIYAQDTILKNPV
jgi:hypothetical protein